jgi:hypothetical protein
MWRTLHYFEVTFSTASMTLGFVLVYIVLHAVHLETANL